MPLGTLYHFDSDLGLSSDLDAALDVIAAGRVERIDVAEMNGGASSTTRPLASIPFSSPNEPPNRNVWAPENLPRSARRLSVRSRLHRGSG
ncbi:hypothetical protein [Mesorhizobium sp. PAMC28654]|uniref:hypothetical protein n=1 Tax=Mesorhizobium sp. PAMC28654 TaxID=2880934 RepID=UPI0039B64E05